MFLTIPQRLGNLSLVLMTVLLLALFVYHQMVNSGFFLASFGPLEMFWLYGPIFLSLLAPLERALSGRRDPGQLSDEACNLLLAVGSLWLLVVFPFDFSRIASPLPEALQPVCAWLTDYAARTALILQLIVVPVSTLFAIWTNLAPSRFELALRS